MKRSMKNAPCSTREQGLDPLPASTGIQAHLWWPELLAEIEAIAKFLTGENRE
jgi:hypothetical protein